jgi:hypothetical protein
VIRAILLLPHALTGEQRLPGSRRGSPSGDRPPSARARWPRVVSYVSMSSCTWQMTCSDVTVGSAKSTRRRPPRPRHLTLRRDRIPPVETRRLPPQRRPSSTDGPACRGAIISSPFASLKVLSPAAAPGGRGPCRLPSRPRPHCCADRLCHVAGPLVKSPCAWSAPCSLAERWPGSRPLALPRATLSGTQVYASALTATSIARCRAAAQ